MKNARPWRPGAGRVMRKNVCPQTFFDKGMETFTIEPGDFVFEHTIQQFGIPDSLFLHPDTLRIRGAFDFAAEHKKTFSVGVIRTMNGRGDVLMASVIAKALKYRYGEQVSVWFAVQKGYEVLLEHNPYIDKVYTTAEEMMRDAPSIHFGVNDLEFKAELSDYEKNGEVVRNRASIYLENLDLYLENKTPAYVVTEEEAAWAEEELYKLFPNNKKRIAVQLFGSNATRTYPHMGDVCAALADRYSILHLDSEKNKKKYALRETIALQSQCALSITPNSMFYHTAGAMKKRAITLFGSCDGNVWTEDYEKVTALQIDCPIKAHKKKCWWTLECLPGGNLREKEVTKAPPCLERISVAQVESAVEDHFNAKKILVVVLTYNLLNLTKQMLDSIRSFHDYDILVIDNESTDGTQDWAENMGIHLIEKRQSVAAAWNMGMQVAHMSGYDYCLLCNNDVILSPGYIDTIVEVAERRRAHAVTGQVIQKGSVPQNQFHDMIKKVELALHTMAAGDYSALLISRACIEEIGQFDTQFAPRYQADEDHMLRIRLAKRELIKTYATNFFHLLGAVVNEFPEERAKMDSEWQRNIALFRKKWGIDPYSDRRLLAHLDKIKDRTPDWESLIKLELEGINSEEAVDERTSN